MKRARITSKPGPKTRTYRLEEAAELLGVSKNYVWLMCRAGTFPTPALKLGGMWFILRDPLDRLLDGKLPKA